MTDNNHKQEKGINFSFRIEPAVYAAISKLAIAEDRSMAYVVNRALNASSEIAEAMAEADAETAAAHVS